MRVSAPLILLLLSVSYALCMAEGSLLRKRPSEDRKQLDTEETHANVQRMSPTLLMRCAQELARLTRHPTLINRLILHNLMKHYASRSSLQTEPLPGVVKESQIKTSNPKEGADAKEWKKRAIYWLKCIWLLRWSLKHFGHEQSSTHCLRYWQDTPRVCACIV